MKLATSTIGALALFFSFGQSLAIADGSGDPTPATQTNGENFDKAGNPTFKIDKDGTVDWYTSIGYLQYGANCLQCHGPDGLGSSYAPNLVDALKSLSYQDFITIVAGGKKEVNTSEDLVMPALGTNKNVMCHIDAIYIYLRARSDGALGRDRPNKVGSKPQGFDETEEQCLGP